MLNKTIAAVAVVFTVAACSATASTSDYWQSQEEQRRAQIAEQAIDCVTRKGARNCGR